MAFVTVQVQGADGVKQPVLLDSITGQTYAIPIYKLGVGALGTDDGVVSTANPLPALLGSLISSGNSTTDLLSGGATFTGVVEDVSNYTTISVSILGTLATATGTLQFQTSSDGITFATIPRTVTNVTIDVPHVFLIAEKFFRIRYINDSIAQTGSFRIQTMYSNARPMVLSSTIEQNISINQDCALSRVVSNIDLDLARKIITGQRAFFFFGFNNVFGTATWEDVHPLGGDINWLTVATKVEVLSSHADDTNSAGIGTRSVEVHGLSATGEDQDETILLNGTTPVESSLTYIRVNKMHNEKVGTYGGSHKGDITCRVTGGGVTLATMTGVEGVVDISVQYGSGEAGNGYWSVPLGKVLYITNLEVFINAKANQTADIVLYEREDLLNVSGDVDPRRVLWDAIEVTGEVTKTFKSHIKIKGLTDVFFRAQASGSGTKISVHMDFYLLDANASGE